MGQGEEQEAACAAEPLLGSTGLWAPAVPGQPRGQAVPWELCARGSGCAPGLPQGAAGRSMFAWAAIEKVPGNVTMKQGASDALGLHCNPCYILCLHFADLTDYSVSKKFFLDFSCVLLATKSLPPVQKSSLSSEPSKKLLPIQKVFEEKDFFISIYSYRCTYVLIVSCRFE